jgi:putative redox protein
MKDSIQLNWKTGMAFEAEVDGFKLVVDAKDEVSGSRQGPRPKPLMMVALAGCTGMDVVSLLEKMRVKIDGFTIKTDGELTEEHPKHFTKMHLIYEFKGKDLPIDKLEKAIDLSMERYCGVGASYRKSMEITHEIKIIE